LVQTGEKDVSTSTANPYTILLEIAKAVYLEDVLFGKHDTPQRLEVNDFRSK
jgi:hypothetical protein